MKIIQFALKTCQQINKPRLKTLWNDKKIKQLRHPQWLQAKHHVHDSRMSYWWAHGKDPGAHRIQLRKKRKPKWFCLVASDAALPRNCSQLPHEHQKEVFQSQLYYFVPLFYHSTLLEDFKHGRTNLCWRLDDSDTSLSECLDFVLGSTLSSWYNCCITRITWN